MGTSIRRTLLASALAATVATAGSASAVGSRSATWKTFTSTRYGYSLAYPPGWRVVKATTSTMAEGFPTEPQPAVDKFLSCGDNCPTGIAVVVYARKLPAAKTLLAFATDEASALASGYACGKPKSRRHATLAHEPAIALTYPICLGNYLVEYALVHHGRGFDIYLLAPPGHEKRDRTTLLSLLKTLRFTE